MAHHFDDIACRDLWAQRLGLQTRSGVGPDGEERWYQVLCSPEEADEYARREELPQEER